MTTQIQCIADFFQKRFLEVPYNKKTRFYNTDEFVDLVLERSRFYQKVICVAIDIRKLRVVEKVECPICSKGILIPSFNAPPERAPQFYCNNCGSKLTINFKK